MPRKRYDTPHRSRVVKTRMTEEEYADFAARLAPYGISQSEFIRRAIQGASIRPVITVSSVNDELLAALGKLTAEYGASETTSIRSPVLSMTGTIPIPSLRQRYGRRLPISPP